MKAWSGRALVAAGWVWIGLAVLFILANLAVIALKEGVGTALGIMSPWNVLNYVVIVATLLPGIGLRIAGEKLQAAARLDKALDALRALPDE